MSQVVTMLEARVDPERVSDLRAAYTEAEGGPFPPGFVRSALLQLTADRTEWRIETVWASHDALAAMRVSGKPRGVQMFEAAGATPSLSVFDLVASLQPPPGAA